MKIEEKEDIIINTKKQKKNSIQKIRNIQRILIEPIPLIKNKSNELVKKEQLLKLLKNEIIVEERADEVIDKYLDENGKILRKDIPLIMEEVLNNLKDEQMAIEEDIVQEHKDKDMDGEPLEDVCAICIEILVDEIEVLDCSHEYHTSCITEWMRQNPVCPECRAHIKPAMDFPPLARNVQI